MTATPMAVVVLPLFAPPSCGPVATSAGLPLAWGTAGNALARRVPGGRGGWADPRRGHQREQGGRGWTDSGRWDGVKSGFIFPILLWRCPTVRTALTCHPEHRGCLARVPRSQAEHGAAWRWLVLDKRHRMGEGSAQGCPGMQAAREAGPTAGLTSV
jgi:hypothetical protein